jgi:hypothetical protein
LSPEKRAEAREMRLRMAERGERRPVHVVDANYQRLSGICPWWDATVATAGEAAKRR